MHAPMRRVLAPVALALTVALAACGGQQAAATPVPTEEPTAAPTRTPRPTREPVALPTTAPTEAPTEAPAADATAGTVLGSDEIQPVEFGDLVTYEHPSGVFAIDIPENWSLQDNSQPDEIILVWTDPSRNGGVIVDIFEDETEYSEEQLTDILRTFLENSFGSEREFQVEEPTPQDDGSVLLVWTYLAEADNGAEVELLGNSFVEQRGNKVSILTTLVPSEQFDAVVESTNEIINTYSIDPSAELVVGEAPAGDSAAPAAPTGGDADGPPATIVAIGETVEVGEGLTMTVTGVEESAGDGTFTPDAGNTFVIVQASFENSGSEAQPVSTLLQMSLFDSEGNKYDVDIGALVLAGETPDGEVPAGGSLAGGVGFQVPEGTTGLVFVFDPLIGGERVGVALE